MASEAGSSSDQSSFTQELLNSTNRGNPFVFPFIIGFNHINPSPEPQNQLTPGSSRDRVIMINPITQSTFIIENGGGSPGLESLFRDMLSRKSGPRPASKASIELMPSIEIVKGENGEEQCAVCLEELEDGQTAREMPCKHRFHGSSCIEKWLKINGTCPVCRYEMPVDEDEDASRKTRRENEVERGRGFWLTINFGGDWRRWEINQIISDENISNHQETVIRETLP